MCNLRQSLLSYLHRSTVNCVHLHLDRCCASQDGGIALLAQAAAGGAAGCGRQAQSVYLESMSSAGRQMYVEIGHLTIRYLEQRYPIAVPPLQMD